MYDPWVKALDLQQWAQRNEARGTLPSLVRRLIWATTKGQREFSFPAGEGVQRPSWDGKLTVDQGNVWVPNNSSVWEMSVGNPPKTKAAENYQKRTEAILAEVASQLTFIFVTPLKWIDKQDWVNERMAEGVWLDVRVFDSDDLEHWLEAAPAVDVWLARIVGKAPVGVRDLSRRWDHLAALTIPPLPATAFLAGRQMARGNLEKALGSGAREVPVAASSEQELVDFVAAAFGSLGEHDPLPSRLVLVETREAWDQIVGSTEPLVLLPATTLRVDRANITQAVKAGHYIITRRPYTAQAESGIIRLPRAWRHELRNALLTAGFPTEQAKHLAYECGGYLDVLQRLASPGAGTALPAWALEPDAVRLAPFILFGSWDDAKDADREVVTHFTESTYDSALALATGWLVRPETLFRRTGTKWHIVSREDAWVNLAPRLTRPLLDNFASIAFQVLSEDDPRFELDPAQRPFAVIHGKLPRHSGNLREGLAETLALLGADLISLPAMPAGAGPSYARKIVRELLPVSLSARRWFTLSPILKLLAEAAPEDFLSAVERDIAQTHPALLGVFSGDDGGIFGSSRHHYLMWALTSLAWHPDYLARTSLILSRLAALDPGGKTNPRPAGSLHDIFRLWFPQTGANAEKRFEVIDLLIEREQQQAWKLMIALLPKGRDATSGTYPPRWREWPSEKEPRVSPEAQGTQVNWLATRLFKLAVTTPARLLEITGLIDHLPDDQFNALTHYLLNIDLNVFALAECFTIWECLRELIRRHEYFKTSDWRMSEARIEVLKRVELHLRPEDPAKRGRWLFAQHDTYMGIYNETSHEKQEEMVFEQRKILLAEILTRGGIQAIAEFAATLPYPGLVGDVLGCAQLCPDSSQLLPKYLDDTNQNVVVFGRGYAGAIFSQRNWAWVQELPLQEWTVNAAKNMSLVLPFAKRTWVLVQTLGPEVDSGYWTTVHPFPRGLDSEQASEGLRQLLKHDRPLDSARYLSMIYYNKLTVLTSLLAEVLEKCIPALNHAISSGRDLSTLLYDLTEIVNHLQDAPDNVSEQVAHLEWAYLPLINNGRLVPKFLHRELDRNPVFFVQCVELIWNPDIPGNEPVDQTAETKARAELANELLESWDTHPALLIAGGPDEHALRVWVEDVRRRCEILGRLNACDYQIGKLFASSPSSSDGTWPCIAVRNILEVIPGETALGAFYTGVFNGRGGTTRGIHDGGELERQLAKKYHGFADACQMRWPRVSATLRNLAKVYEADACRMDEEADDHA